MDSKMRSEMMVENASNEMDFETAVLSVRESCHTHDMTHSCCPESRFPEIIFDLSLQRHSAQRVT